MNEEFFFEQLIKKSKNTKERITEDIIWKILTQIVIKLHYIYIITWGKIFHWDIKPSKIKIII